MRYDKTATIVLALCISLGIHTKADARWNWYDRVLQPIVSNQMGPAWESMIVTAERKLADTIFQKMEKLAPGITGSLGGLMKRNVSRDVAKGDTVVETEQELDVALKEAFLENVKSGTTTIESLQPGMYDFVSKVLNANKQDREETDDKWETMININKGTYDDGKGTFEAGTSTRSYDSHEVSGEDNMTTYRQIINPDGSVKKADKINRNSVVISYTGRKDGYNEGKENKERSIGNISISTPSAQALLIPDVYYETKNTMLNYQFNVFKEKSEENKATLERINTLMSKITELEKVALTSGNEQNEINKSVAEIISAIADETDILNRANKNSDKVDNKYDKLDEKTQNQMDEYAGIIGDHINELAVLTDEEEWLDDYIDENQWRWNDDYYDDIVPTSVLQARLDAIKSTGEGTQAIQNEIQWLENMINPPEQNNYYNSYYWDDDYGVYVRRYGYYDDDGYFHYFGVRYSDLYARLNAVRSTISTEEQIFKEYCDKFENTYKEYQARQKEYASEVHASHEQASKSREKLAELTLQLTQAKGNAGTTSKQEKERKAMIESLRAELAVETAKLEEGSNRLDQAIEVYNKEAKEVERKKSIAAMNYQGFDPYNLSDSEVAAGMETPEQLDKGYVTRKGKRKL